MTAGQISLEDAARERDEGMQRVAENAGSLWLSDARDWLYGYLRTHPFLRPDDAKYGGCPEPVNGWRAFGPVVARARREGWIVHDGYAPRASGHLTPSPVWKSTLFVESSRA